MKRHEGLNVGMEEVQIVIVPSSLDSISDIHFTHRPPSRESLALRELDFRRDGRISRRGDEFSDQVINCRAF